MVEDHHRGHCLDNGNGTRNNTGVVAAFRHKGHRLSMLIDGGLRFQKRCNGLKCGLVYTSDGADDRISGDLGGGGDSEGKTSKGVNAGGG